MRGKLFMHYFAPTKRSRQIVGNAGLGIKFVRVELPVGQEVCFDVSRLICVERTVKLGVKLSISLAAFLRTQLLYTVASGPGAIIFKVPDGSLKIMPPDAPEGAHPQNIKTFDFNGPFFIRGGHDLLNLMWIQHNIVPSKNTLAVREAPKERTFLAGTALRRILFFVLPVF